MKPTIIKELSIDDLATVLGGEAIDTRQPSNLAYDVGGLPIDIRQPPNLAHDVGGIPDAGPLPPWQNGLPRSIGMPLPGSLELNSRA
jgi:hypothetical protein